MRPINSINVRCVQKYQGFYGVPDFEIRRCYLLEIHMVIQHWKDGSLYNEILIPIQRLVEGQRTGLFRQGKIGNTGIKYEIINFKIHDFEQVKKEEDEGK